MLPFRNWSASHELVHMSAPETVVRKSWTLAQFAMQSPLKNAVGGWHCWTQLPCPSDMYSTGHASTHCTPPSRRTRCDVLHSSTHTLLVPSDWNRPELHCFLQYPASKNGLSSGHTETHSVVSLFWTWYARTVALQPGTQIFRPSYATKNRQLSTHASPSRNGRSSGQPN